MLGTVTAVPSRMRSVAVVVLADAEDVEPDGLGEPGLLDDQADGLDLAERVEPQFESLGGHGLLLLN
ncbi:hypothetical protein ACFZDK_45210 [Streptomyces sp. NPDC007901]|uniref:hypothetical protein n=1 Tax=Streptomyces sp. NPDC007901 TaxID=3364785 RepID=UPI0036F0D5BA